MTGSSQLSVPRIFLILFQKSLTETKTIHDSTIRNGHWEEAYDVPVRSSVLLKQAYVIMRNGPKTGSNLTAREWLRANTKASVNALTCVVKSAGIETEPKIEHPPCYCPKEGCD